MQQGRVHSGFYNAYRLIETYPKKEVIESFTKIIPFLDKGRKLFLTGHSLGGALCLIHATHLTEYKPCLYTYGCPRAFSLSGINEIGDKIIHYRHVNETDLVASLPPQKDIGEYPLTTQAHARFQQISEVTSLPEGYSTSLLITGLIDIVGDLFKLGNLNKTAEDPYSHHGELIYFYRPSFYTLNTANTELMKIEKYECKEKLYLVPQLEQATNDRYIATAEEEIAAQNKVQKLFPDNDNATSKDIEFNFTQHYMMAYITYLSERIYSYLITGLDPAHSQNNQRKQARDNHIQQVMDKLKSFTYQSNETKELTRFTFVLDKKMQNYFVAQELQGIKKELLQRFYYAYRAILPDIEQQITASLKKAKTELEEKLKKTAQELEQDPVFKETKYKGKINSGTPKEIETYTKHYNKASNYFSNITKINNKLTGRIQ